MAAVTDVQRLQTRVEELERWVYGPGGSRGSRKVSDLGCSGPFLGQSKGGLLAWASRWMPFQLRRPHSGLEITKVRDIPEHIGRSGSMPMPMQGTAGY